MPDATMVGILVLVVTILVVMGPMMVCVMLDDPWCPMPLLVFDRSDSGWLYAVGCWITGVAIIAVFAALVGLVFVVATLIGMAVQHVA